MIPEDPKIDMAKILLFIFAFIMVFVGNTSGILSSEKKETPVALSLNLFND